ncbi:MAG: FAD:protein FMN transferase [bacterium]
MQAKNSVLYRLFIGLSLGVVLATLPSCGAKSISLTRSRLLMGHVPVNVTIQTSSERKKEALEASEEAYSLAQSIEKKISEYQPDSEISCLNRMAGKGSCRLSDETLSFLKEGKSLSDLTGHAFDLRFASLSAAGRKGEILLEGHQGRLAHPDTRLGVGSIGKGMILDAMIEFLKSRGFTAALVDAGGDLRALGGPWKVAIQKPGAPPGTFSKVFEIRDRAIATSGNYEQPGHISDPRTGEKITRNLSVTVIADRHVLANAVSTAFYVMGEEESRKYLPQFSGILILWAFPDGKIHEATP